MGMRHQVIKSLLLMVLEALESKIKAPGDSVSEKDWSMCFQVEGLMLHLQVAERVKEQKSTNVLPEFLAKGAKDRYDGRATML